MKNLTTGTGLCIAGLCAVAFPFAQKLASVDSAAHAGVDASALAAVASASVAQVTPTIVWYGTDTVTQGMNGETYACSIVWRAWSDGKVEAMTTRRRATGYNGNSFDSWCTGTGFCTTGWTVVSSPAQGLTYRSDINFDEQVDGADLGQLLADWGNAPRQDIPPSDCPLALINP